MICKPKGSQDRFCAISSMISEIHLPAYKRPEEKWLSNLDESLYISASTKKNSESKDQATASKRRKKSLRRSTCVALLWPRMANRRQSFSVQTSTYDRRASRKKCCSPYFWIGKLNITPTNVLRIMFSIVRLGVLSPCMYWRPQIRVDMITSESRPQCQWFLRRSFTIISPQSESMRQYVS